MSVRARAEFEIFWCNSINKHKYICLMKNKTSSLTFLKTCFFIEVYKSKKIQWILFGKTYYITLWVGAGYIF